MGVCGCMDRWREGGREGREGKEGGKERDREGRGREGGRDGGPAILSIFFFHLMDFLGTVHS